MTRRKKKTRTRMTKPSGSYRLRVTVSYHDIKGVPHCDKREATFEADSLDDAIGEADGWIVTYLQEYGENGHFWEAMDDIGLYDQAGDGLLATLGGLDGVEWEIVERDGGRSKAERRRSADDLIARSANMVETLKRLNYLVARGRYDDAVALLAWLPEDVRTMQGMMRKLIEG